MARDGQTLIRKVRSLVIVAGRLAAAWLALAAIALPGPSPAHGALPVVFEANRGQADSRVAFLARAGGYTLFLTADEAVLAARHTGQTVRVRLVGARPGAEIVGLDPLPGVVHYLRGRDPGRWLAGVPTYAAVAYREVYAGIDAIYRAGPRVEHMFVVRPGADPAAIGLIFSGARALAVDASGDLRVALDAGEFRLRRPVAYQEVGGTRRDVPVAWTIDGARHARFRLGQWDRSRALVIDPEIVWATHLGGRGTDEAFAIAVDGAGAAYVAGETRSLDFPGLSPPPGGCSEDPLDDDCLGDDSDAFVVKIDPSGAVLLYAVVLSGGGDEGVRAIAVDGAGNAHVAGFTDSADFPTTFGAFQRDLGGGLDAFVTKLGPTGTVLFSTYLGGAEADVALGLAIDASGAAHVAGGTRSADFPIFVGSLPWSGGAHPLQPTLDGGRDAFLATLAPSGATLQFSTFLGGSADDSASGLARDGFGNLWLAGFTLSSDFPTTPGVLQPGDRAGQDAFVARVSPSGALAWATYLGGSGTDTANAVAVHDGEPYVVGSTASPDFPATGGASFSGLGEGFVTRLRAAGDQVRWSRSLGGNVPAAVATDSAGDALVVANGPACAGVVPCVPHVDVFVERRLASSGERFLSIRLGGRSSDAGTPPDDLGQAIAVRGREDVGIAGVTFADDFPATPGSVQPVTANAFSDAFVARLTYEAIGEAGDDDDSDASVSCFVSTAFGSPAGAEVAALRRFRDLVLVTGVPGRLLVRAYYQASPWLAGVVADRPAYGAVVRWLLWPIARGTDLALDHTRAALALLAAGIVAIALLVTRARRRGLVVGVALVAVAVVGALTLGGPPDAVPPVERPEPSRPEGLGRPAAASERGTVSGSSVGRITSAADGARRERAHGRSTTKPIRLRDLVIHARPNVSVQLLNPLAAPAQRRWAIASPFVAGVLGPDGFAVTDPRAAAGLGLRAGDTVVAINGHPPTGVLAAVGEVQRDPDRATVVVEIDRAGGRITQAYRVR